MVDIGVAFTALSGAMEIAKGLKNIDDKVRLNAAVIELQEKILSAQQATVEAREQLRALMDEVAAFQGWEITASRYVLKDYGGGTFAYELLPEHAVVEPMHRICPSCFDDRKRGILQFQFRDYCGQDQYKCSSCARELKLGKFAPPPNSGVSDEYDPLG